MDKRRFATLMFYFFIIMIVAYAVYAVGHPRLTQEARVQWSDMPPAAQEKILVQAEGGQVDEIIKDVRNNKTYYKAVVKTPAGQEIMLKVEDTGKLVGLRYKDESDADCGNGNVGQYSSPTR